MRKPSKGEAVVLATVLGLGAGGAYLGYESTKPSTGGEDKTHEAEEAPEASAARQAREKQMDEARAGREAIAKRYAGCAITKVVDTHTSAFIEGAPTERGKEIPRNKVIITVEATTTPESAAAEAKYAKGTPNAQDVKWHPFGGGAEANILEQDGDNPDVRHRAVSVPASSTAEKTGPNTETFTVSMYPRIDDKRTTSAEISLGTHVSTPNPEGNNGNGESYVSIGRVSCGTVYEDVDITSNPNQLEPGPLTWQASQSKTEGIEEFMYEEQTCLNVPTGPNTYDVQCN